MKYVIIGGVAGGATVATRLRRLDEKAEIVILEKGKYISYANCGLPYYIGGIIKSKNALLLQTPESFYKRFRVDVRVLNEAISIHPNRKELEIKNINNDKTYSETYDKLILSPGASPLVPKIPGIHNKKIHTLRNVSDAYVIKTFVDKQTINKVVVVGGGFIGLEMIENFKQRNMEVTLVEVASQVMNVLDPEMAAILHQHFKEKSIGLYLNDGVRSFGEKENGNIITKLQSGKEIEAEFVLLAVGVKPDTSLAKKADLQITERGAIIVDSYLQTSRKDIYAIGDAIAFPHPVTGQVVPTYLAGPANKQARILADNLIYGNQKKYKGSYGTTIAGVFDYTAGITGLSEKQAKKTGLSYQTTTTYPFSHANYYPKAKPICMKIVFDKNRGTLFGAQAVGKKGVDKRIDVIATLLGKKGTIYDLQEIEHAYAPPYSSAKDPVNLVGFLAENISQGLVKVIDYEQMHNRNNETILLDVRTRNEHKKEAIPDSINIPVDEIRKNLDKIPKDNKLYLYCKTGLRGYIACRILLQNGFSEVYNLQGGYDLYKHFCANQNNEI